MMNKKESNVPEATRLRRILLSDRLLRNTDITVEKIADSAPQVDPLLFLGEVEKEHPQLARLMVLTGIHPTIQEPRRNVFTGELVNEWMGNIGEHSIAVMLAHNIMARKLEDVGVISSEEVASGATRALTEDFGKPIEINIRRAAPNGFDRALTHDALKPMEIDGKNAARQGVIDKAFIYSPEGAAFMTRFLLETGQVPPGLVDYINHAGKETGHNSLMGFVELGRGGPRLVGGRWTDKLVHLADDMTSTTIEGQTRFLTPNERMIMSGFKTRYSFLYTEGFGFNEDGVAVIEKDVANSNLRYVRTYAEWQVIVSNAICDEFKGVVGDKSKLWSEVWVKQMVNIEYSRLAVSAYTDQLSGIVSAMNALSPHLRQGSHY